MAGPFPVEIWHTIATDFIISSKTLRCLCLVSKSFNAIFTPYFYAYIVLQEKHQYSGITELPLHRLGNLNEERCLAFIKHIELPRMLHKEEHWAALGKLFNRATNLKGCTVSCEPVDMMEFDYPGIHIDGVHVDYNMGRQFTNAEFLWRRTPQYKNLRHLSLYSMSRGPTLGAQIARILADSPGLRSLGMGLNQLASRHRGGSHDFLTEIANAFERYCNPGIRLEIEDLKLGYLVSNCHALAYDSNALSRLTDLSKLQKFSHLNQSRPAERGEERFVADLNYEILLQAKNLKGISSYFCTKGLVLLINELSQQHPRTLREIKIHTIDSKWRLSQSFQALEHLGGGWKRIHLGGTTSVETSQTRDYAYSNFVAQSYDFIEEFGIYSTFGCPLESEIIEYTNLRRLFLVHSYGFSSSHHDAQTREIRIVTQLFHHHRTEMKKKGLQSKLKYIGIGIDRRIYTIMWPAGREAGVGGLTQDVARMSTAPIMPDDYQVTALSREEAETFDAFVPGQL